MNEDEAQTLSTLYHTTAVSLFKYTVEPPNKGHYGATILSLVERLSLSRRYNNTLKY